MAAVNFKTSQGEQEDQGGGIDQSTPQRPTSSQAVPRAQHTQRLAGRAGEAWVPEAHKARVTADSVPRPHQAQDVGAHLMAHGFPQFEACLGATSLTLGTVCGTPNAPGVNMEGLLTLSPTPTRLP